MPIAIDDMNRHGRRIQELVEKIEALPDPHARELVHECMTSLLGFYGQGLERVLRMQRVGDRRAEGLRRVDPRPGSERPASDSRTAPGRSRNPAPRGARKDPPVHAEPRRRCRVAEPSRGILRGCVCKGRAKPVPPPLSPWNWRSAMPSRKRARICSDSKSKEPPSPSAADEVHHAAPEWTEIREAQQLQEGALIRATVLGASLIICRTAGNLYAYRDRCPACNLPLHLGTLQAGVLGMPLGASLQRPRGWTRRR